jgi:hypothetical protein
MYDEDIPELEDVIDSNVSVVKEINARRTEIDRLVKDRIETENDRRKRCCRDIPTLNFTVSDLLDPANTDNVNFENCIRFLYPLYTNTRKERAQMKAVGNYSRKLWYPLLTYFIETNQFEKFEMMAATSQCDRSVARYDQLLRLISLFKPVNFAKFFAHTLNEFCFGFTSNGSFDPIKIDGEVLKRDDMKEIAKWVDDMKMYDPITEIISPAKFEDTNFVPEPGSEKHEDYGHYEHWEIWREESQASLIGIMGKIK